MERLTDLKAILHSKRANIFYLEKCRVMQKDCRVLYLTEDNRNKQYWNIPIANTTCILLGNGTSITQAAMRMLASAGVLVGFCGGGGTPLISGNEVEWLSPQSEYRPTEYVQRWMQFWFDGEKRLKAAKTLQQLRIEYLQKVWGKDRDLHNAGFYADDEDVESLLIQSLARIDTSPNINNLLLTEAQLTKGLYKISAKRTKLDIFVRDHAKKEGANAFLNHGNYLAYGLAATTLWVLGIPHGFAVMHGKTIKDALVLPWAFICVKDQASEQEFRQQCLLNFTGHKALDFMFNAVKQISREGAAL